MCSLNRNISGILLLKKTRTHIYKADTKTCRQQHFRSIIVVRDRKTLLTELTLQQLNDFHLINIFFIFECRCYKIIYRKPMHIHSLTSREKKLREGFKKFAFLCKEIAKRK